MSPCTPAATPRFNLLSEPLIRWRRQADGATQKSSLPELFVALSRDEVRDFPRLRPHQRHPWHAFLCHVAALALHRAGRAQPFDTAQAWSESLLALVGPHGESAAWCLVAPPGQPALLQAPEPDGSLATWRKVVHTPDALDMLVTSKNHDLKCSRAFHAECDDWLFALLSLQSQEGFLGARNYGVSRMNGGFASRPGIGAEPEGGWGESWHRDTQLLLSERDRISEEHGFDGVSGLALVWLQPWDGTRSLTIGDLDPLYIEVCRRVRLELDAEGSVSARCTGSQVARISAGALNGVTGDLWTPVEIAGPKALTINADGFHYRLVTELLTGGKYRPARAQRLLPTDAVRSWHWVARGVVRGQGKTEGFHERRIPLTPRFRMMVARHEQAELAAMTGPRIDAISAVRNLLWQAVMLLLNNGAADRDATEAAKRKAKRYVEAFERDEDARFFSDLSTELESDDGQVERLRWLQGLVQRGERHLELAFDAAPRSAMRRHRAQAQALNRFWGGLLGPKSPLPMLAEHYRQHRPPIDLLEETT